MLSDDCFKINLLANMLFLHRLNNLYLRLLATSLTQYPWTCMLCLVPMSMMSVYIPMSMTMFHAHAHVHSCSYNTNEKNMYKNMYCTQTCLVPWKSRCHVHVHGYVPAPVQVPKLENRYEHEHEHGYEHEHKHEHERCPILGMRMYGESPSLPISMWIPDVYWNHIWAKGVRAKP